MQEGHRGPQKDRTETSPGTVRRTAAEEGVVVADSEEAGTWAQGSRAAGGYVCGLESQESQKSAGRP